MLTGDACRRARTHLKKRDNQADKAVTAQPARMHFVHVALIQEGLCDHDE